MLAFPGMSQDTPKFKGATWRAKKQCRNPPCFENVESLCATKIQAVLTSNMSTEC